MDLSASTLPLPGAAAHERSGIGGESLARLRGDAPDVEKRKASAPPAADDIAKVAARAPSRSLGKRALLAVAVLFALTAAGRFGWHWWTDGRFEETTDNAFLQADKVVVAPKVGGFVAEVFVGDNQPVKAGQVLARIDDRDFRVALLQSQADVDKARAGLEGVAAAMIQQEAKIAEAKADVANTTAALNFATEEETRYDSLLQKGAGTIQRSHQANSDLLQKQAALDKAKASYDAAQKQTESLRSLEDAARASLQRYKSTSNRQNSTSNIRRSARRSTASSATGPCARASSCSPAPVS